MADFIVRPMTLRDVPGAVALQRSCFPPPFPEELLWSMAHLQRHLEVFPEGQLVVTEAGQPLSLPPFPEDNGSGGLGGEESLRPVLASASSLRISESSWHSLLDWQTTTGGPFLSAHDPGGSTLYGVDISVHPSYRGIGLGRALYQARFDLVRKLRLVRYGTACRLPEFKSSGERDVETYVRSVAEGRRRDRTLTPLVRYGLRCIGIIPNYMEDEESGNAAALLEWKC